MSSSSSVIDQRAIHLFSASPTIIKIILSHFSYQELLQLQRVSKLWMKYAKHIISQRKLCLSFGVCKPAYWMASNPCISLSALPEMSQLKNVGSSVNMGIVFGKVPLSRPCKGGHDFTGIRTNFAPQSKLIGCISSCGIIGKFSDDSLQAVHNPKTDCISALFLSELDSQAQAIRINLTLNQFKNKFSSEESVVQMEDVEEMFSLPKYQPVRALFLASAQYFPSEIVCKVANAVFEREHRKVAFCGGIVDSVYKIGPGPHSGAVEDCGMVGCAFVGENVHAASVIIPPSVKSYKRVREKLQKLQEFRNALHSPPKMCFAIQITCNGKGKYHFGKENVEVGIFHELLPDVELIGLFSMGEFGWTYLPGIQGDKLSIDDIQHTYSTIIPL